MSEPRVLVVDDEKSMRDLLAITLQKAGYEVTLADGGEPRDRGHPPGEPSTRSSPICACRRSTGSRCCARAKDLSPETAVIVVTAMASTETAVEAMKLGAYDYITKPFKLDEVNLIIRNAPRAQAPARREPVSPEAARDPAPLREHHRARARRMVEVFDTIRKIADSPSTAMITGESGTGKELVARAIHFNGHRRDKPFVSVNCGAIPEGLMESELFGHVKGAFTGAVANKIGLFTRRRGRHAVPRRDHRDPRPAAGEAAAGHPGARDPAGR